MKQYVNNFAVTGIVGADAQVRNFENTSVARFSLAISHAEKTDGKPTYTSAFLAIEAWRKNSNLTSFDLLKKGTHLTVEGYFKPEEWTDAESGTKRNRIIFTATRFYATPDEEKEEAQKPAKKGKKKEA